MDAIMRERHSVRSFLSKSIPANDQATLQTAIAQINQESQLHFQLITDDPHAFEGLMAHYGQFDNVQNYIALIGPKRKDLDEKVGYYGEKLVLLATSLGLNTCWVAMTFKKGAVRKQCTLAKGEKLAAVIALGYGTHQGQAHRSKPLSDICDESSDTMPEWYRQGLEAALLAPTAMNQQKFFFTRQDQNVHVKATGGFYSQMDLGIVKYHFELGAGKDQFHWI